LLPFLSTRVTHLTRALFSSVREDRCLDGSPSERRSGDLEINMNTRCLYATRPASCSPVLLRVGRKLASFTSIMLSANLPVDQQRRRFASETTRHAVCTRGRCSPLHEKNAVAILCSALIQ